MTMATIESLAGFRVARYLFRLTAVEPMLLPPYKGSTLRGGFGHAFRRSSCADPDRPGCRGCLLAQVCAYSYCFATTVPPESEVLRNLGEIPRPFVIEPPDSEAEEVRAGQSLDFGLVLIGRGIEYFPYFLLSFQRLGEIGVGKGRSEGRGRFRVAGVWTQAPWSDGPQDPVYDAASDRVAAGMAPAADSGAVSARVADLLGQRQGGRLAVSFLTMTRLKSDRDYARRPEFHTLLRALLRRVSALSYFHGGERIEADYRGLAERARAVALARDETRWRDWTRYSSRQDNRMDLGGLIGRAEYAGELAEFLPWLIWGELVHAGKNATFGLGKIRIVT